eukprot:3682422-Alexandrium_andersonii.AAC.1
MLPPRGFHGQGSWNGRRTWALALARPAAQDGTLEGPRASGRRPEGAQRRLSAMRHASGGVARPREAGPVEGRAWPPDG